MKAKVLTTAGLSALVLMLSAAAPAAPAEPLSTPGAITAAQAAVSKSLSASGSGGNVSGAGSRLGSLLSGWAVPVLTVLAGCLLVGALISRNLGTAVGVIVITLLGLIFLLAPSSIASLAKEIASTVL